MATSHKVILAETLSPTFVGLTFQVIFYCEINHRNDDDDYCDNYNANYDEKTLSRTFVGVTFQVFS